jgi:hypothetical protein
LKNFLQTITPVSRIVNQADKLQVFRCPFQCLFRLLALSDIPGNLKAGDYLSPGVSDGISRGLPKDNLPRKR